MDTVDRRKSEEWLNNLVKELDKKEPNYLVVSYIELYQSYNIGVIAEKYLNMKIIENDKTFEFTKQFFEIPNLDERKIVVKMYKSRFVHPNLLLLLIIIFLNIFQLYHHY